MIEKLKPNYFFTWQLEKSTFGAFFVINKNLQVKQKFEV